MRVGVGSLSDDGAHPARTMAIRLDSLKDHAAAETAEQNQLIVEDGLRQESTCSVPSTPFSRVFHRYDADRSLPEVYLQHLSHVYFACSMGSAIEGKEMSFPHL